MNYLRERRYLILVLFSLLASIYLYWNFVVDDAYISFVYSRNLITGNGLTYNGMIVEGYSNFLWTLLIAPFLFLGIDPLIAARSLSIVSAILIIFILDELIRHYMPDLTNFGIALALSTVTFCSAFAAWTVGGLETIFFSLLVLLFLYLEIIKPRISIYYSPLVVLLLALTRPEGSMIFVVLVGYRLYKRRSFNHELVQSVLLFIIPFSLFLIWRHQTYGYVLPNTAYIKIHSSLSTFYLAFEWLVNFFVLRPIYGLILIVAIILLIVEKKIFDYHWALIIMIVGAFNVFVLFAGRDWMPFHRFLVPLVPIYAILISKVLLRYQAGISRIIVTALISSIGLFDLVMSTTLYQGQINDFGSFTSGLLEAGNIINQETQSESIIAVEDAGALAYSSERISIDILGLNNDEIAHQPDLDVAEYVLSFRPAIIQLHLEFLPSGEFIGSKDSRISNLILTHPDFSSCYELSTEWLDDPYMPYLFYRRCN